MAWTRARRTLTLSYDPVVPSPFLLEAFTAELAADAARLEAAERCDEVHRVLVDAVRAGAHAARDVETEIGVGGPHRAREAVLAVVGDAHRVGNIVERNHGQYRAEDLITRNPHVVVRIGEHRGLHVPAAIDAGWQTVATHNDARAFLLPERDVLLHPLLLPLGDKRTDLGLGRGRVADVQRTNH